MNKKTLIEIFVILLFAALSLLGLRLLLAMSYQLIRITALIIVIVFIVYVIRFMSKE